MAEDGEESEGRTDVGVCEVDGSTRRKNKREEVSTSRRLKMVASSISLGTYLGSMPTMS